MNLNLNIFHLNVESLGTYFDHFRQFVTGYHWDIVAVSETSVKPDIPENVDIEACRFVRCDRLKRGGGVGFYISNKLKFEVFKSVEVIKQLWISIGTR